MHKFIDAECWMRRNILPIVIPSNLSRTKQTQLLLLTANIKENNIGSRGVTELWVAWAHFLENKLWIKLVKIESINGCDPNEDV